MRILVVEDEALIAFMLEDMLADLGHEVVATAARLPQALEMAEARAFDVAILDVNLDGVKTFPVADVLLRRGIPFAFATGYGREGLDARHRDAAVIRKPFAVAELERTIVQLTT
jgi:CheY-like chemotaxis protein